MSPSVTIGVWGFYEGLLHRNHLFEHANSPIGEDLLLPFNRLHQMGQERGVRFVTLDLVPDLAAVDGLLFLDFPSTGSPIARRALACDRPKFLVTFESPVVKPDNWDEEHHRLFEKIFTYHGPLVDGRKYFKINYAFDLPAAVEPDLAPRARLCTMIAGNKRSASPSGLYQERLRAIRWFEAHHPFDFDLYGKGWSRAEFPSYVSEVASKRFALRQYRFSICYENVRDVSGYVTEKIFDCLLAGCVPVYRGADDIAEHVPRDCFIDQREYGSYEALYAHLAGMSDSQFAHHQESIAEFLGGPASEPFSIRRFCDVIIGECLASIQAGSLRSTEAGSRRPTQAGSLRPTPILGAPCSIAGPARPAGPSVWTPRVSICVPTYNRAGFLRQAVESALAQDYPNLEVVIGDNGSSDGTEQLCRSMAADPRVRYHRNAVNQGPTANFRDCLHHHASGDFALFLSDDDYLVDPGYVSKAVALLRRHRQDDVLLVFSDYATYLEPRQEIVSRSSFGAPELIRGTELLDRWGMPLWIPLLTCLFDRRAAIELRAFDEGDIMASDTMLWWKLCLAGNVGFVDSTAAVYRIHGENDVVSASLQRHLNNLWMFVLPARLAVEAGYDVQWVRRWKLRMASVFLVPIGVPAVRQAFADSNVMGELAALYRMALTRELPAEVERAQEDAILERAVARLTAPADGVSGMAGPGVN